MSLVTRYRLFWAALVAALLGLAFWKNSQSYPGKSRLWRLGKAVIDTGLVVLMVIYAPALLLMYVVIWLTSPFRNKITPGHDGLRFRPRHYPSGRSGLRSCRCAGCVRRGPADRPGAGADGKTSEEQPGEGYVRKPAQLPPPFNQFPGTGW